MKTKTIPVSCLNDIKDDISTFAQRSDLNNFQKWIVTERYMLKPELDFEPQSIIIASVDFKLCNAVFHNAGRTITSIVELPVTMEEVKEVLSQGNNYHYFYDYWLPQKRLAVRSGLAEYGRNNICFVDGMGSLITLFVFISDKPCDEEYTWREVINMDMCNTCNLCRKNCPTGAILADRFLIDNEKCLSAINDSEPSPFLTQCLNLLITRLLIVPAVRKNAPKIKGGLTTSLKPLIFRRKKRRCCCLVLNTKICQRSSLRKLINTR